MWCVHFRRQQHHTIFPGIRRDFRATRNGPVLALAVPEAPPNDRRHFAQSATGRTVAFSGLSTGLRSTTATAAAIRFRVEKEMLAGYYKSAHTTTTTKTTEGCELCDAMKFSHHFFAFWFPQHCVAFDFYLCGSCWCERDRAVLECVRGAVRFRSFRVRFRRVLASALDESEVGGEQGGELASQCRCQNTKWWLKSV